MKSAGSVLAWVMGMVFITLKLLGKIDWSWWWVLAPFWVPIALTTFFLILLLAFVDLARISKK